MKKFIFENLLQTWFKETSEDWSIRTNRSMFRISTKIVGDNWTDFTLLSMGKPGVTVRDMESGKGKFPESFNTYQIVEPNDLIFCLYDMNETPRTVGYSELNGMITPSYTIVKCYEDINPKFLYYLYSIIDDHKGLRPYYTGLRNTIRPETFMNIELKVPTYQDQCEIVKKLDEKLSKIDKLLLLERERIKTFEVLKQSITFDLVTGR